MLDAFGRGEISEISMGVRIIGFEGRSETAGEIGDDDERLRGNYWRDEAQ